MSKFFFGTKVKAYVDKGNVMHAYLPLPSGEKREDREDGSLMFLDGEGDICIFNEDFGLLSELAEIAEGIGDAPCKLYERDLDLATDGKSLDLPIPKWMNDFVCPLGRKDAGLYFHLGYVEQYDHAYKKLMYFMVLRGERSF